ncbi:MAG: hypothetical protein GXP10_10080 [Gammaproteobacteria bacterium]|nr:hypothetical protein [Gammaproteobacteria bacterium]
MSAFVTSLSDNEFWLGMCGLVIVAAAGFYAIFRFLFRAQIIVDTPTSKVRSAAQGYVELRGRGALMDGPPITAPLSGLPCIWYRYTIEALNDAGGGPRWATMESGQSDDLFLLVDGSGECVVDPENAEVIQPYTERWRGNGPSCYIPAGRHWLANLFSVGRYRLTEMRMLPGEPLYAIGYFRNIGGCADAPNSAEEVRHLLSLWKRDRAALLKRFDANGDGEIDLDEWQAARDAAKQQVRKEQVEHAAQPSVHMIAHASHGTRPFLLSRHDPATLVRKYRMYAAAALLLFLLAGALLIESMGIRFSGV